MKITKQWLEERDIFKNKANWFIRNGLEGFPLDRLDGIEGDHHGYICWLKIARVSTYTYDKHGNIRTETDLLGGTWIYTRDDHGNILTETDPRGRAYTYTYEHIDGALHKIHRNGNLILTIPTGWKK